MLSFKNLLRIAINSAIGIILIVFWLKIVNINEVIEKLSKIQLISLLPFIVLFMISFVLRSLRLKLLLAQKIPLINLTYLTSISQLLSFTIPLRIGEVAKAVYLSTEYDLKFSKAIIWILLDRFVDFWVVLVMTLALLFIVPSALPHNLKLSLLILISLSTIAAALLIYLPKLSKQISQTISRVLIIALIERLFLKFTDYIIDTASFLKRNLLESLKIILLTVLVLILDGFGWYTLFLAIYNRPVDYFSVLLGSMLNTLSYMIPAAPGYVGSAEAAGLAVFHFGLGFDKDSVSAITVLMHSLTLFCILVFGLISIYLLKFDLSLVWKKFKKR